MVRDSERLNELFPMNPGDRQGQGAQHRLPTLCREFSAKGSQDTEQRLRLEKSKIVFMGRERDCVHGKSRARRLKTN